MNYRMVGKYLGYLIAAEAVFLLPAVAVAALYGEQGALAALGATLGICAGVALLLILALRKSNSTIYAREGFVVAGAGWILVSFLGGLPFYFSGEIPSLINAFFEASSGFTTTGASILTDVEAMSHGLLFWRSLSHWMGGIGVLAFILAIVRSKSGAGFTVHLMRAETPGPQKGKTMPRMRDSMRSLLLVYGGLSVINLIFLLVGGMPVFDALCTMFGTAGTGGFGIKNDSMASYSIYLQNVTAVFMALFGINFGLYQLALLYKAAKAALKDEELRMYVGIMLGATALMALDLVLVNGAAAGVSLQQSFFTASSVMTTTGFSNTDFNLWPQTSRTIILLLMISGAMAGSTGGGFKVARLLILAKSVRTGLARLLHPRSVKPVRVNGKALEPEVLDRTWLFMVVYCALLLGLWLLVSLDGLSVETNLSAVLSCVNNIGPGLNEVGPMGNYSVYSPLSTLALAFGMLLGRLEIFPILLLLFPGTWSRKA